MKLYSEKSYRKLVAYTFIKGTDHRRTGRLKEDLYNELALGVNSYPCNLSNTTNTITNDKRYARNTNHTYKKKKQANKHRRKIMTSK